MSKKPTAETLDTNPAKSFAFGDEVSIPMDRDNVYVVTHVEVVDGVVNYQVDGNATVGWQDYELQLIRRASAESFNLALDLEGLRPANPANLVENFQMLAFGDRVRRPGSSPTQQWSIVTEVAVDSVMVKYTLNGCIPVFALSSEPLELELIRRATDSDIKLALSIVEEGDESEEDDDEEGDDQDDNALKAWTVSFTYYEDDGGGDNSSDAKFHRQIMYARSEDSIREQIENFMPFNDLKPTDIRIGAPTKL